MRRPAILASNLGRKWLTALGLSLTAVVVLVLAEGFVLRWLGLIATAAPRRSSVLHFAIRGGQGLSVSWVRDEPLDSGRRTSVALHKLPLGQPCETFQWQRVQPQSAAWTGPRNEAVINSEDGTIYTWDASHPRSPPQPLGEHPGSALALAATADGRWLVAASDVQLSMWDLHTRQVRWRSDHQRGNCVAIHPRSENIVLGNLHGEVLELDLHTGQTVRTLARHHGMLNSVAVSPDGKSIASVGFDRRLVVTDWSTAELVWTSPHVSIASVCFSPGSETLVSSGFVDDAWSILVWDAADGRQQARLTGHTRTILGMAFASRGTLYSWSTDGTLREWDLNERRQIHCVTPATREAC